MNKITKAENRAENQTGNDLNFQALPKTLGELRKTNWRSRSVRQELRENLIAKLKQGGPLFPEILGYEQTVEVQLVNAILSAHDFILLGLRGQGKTKIIRLLSQLLDPYMPVLDGTSLNEDPYAPISPLGRSLIEKSGNETAIKWLSNEDRYKEKLATPDVSIADLIGDIDPIKAAREKLDISNEEVIHWGIIPRANRGIFAINELPDLQARIQVGLFNILEERDIQVRGFPLRVPLDLLLVFSANPEDYTNRGRIITPLKDRIDAQIITHYPKDLSIAQKITAQEVKINLEDFILPKRFCELIERVTFAARGNEHIDQMSGVSQRLSISLLENTLSHAMQRTLRRVYGGETANANTNTNTNTNTKANAKATASTKVKGKVNSVSASVDADAAKAPYTVRLMDLYGGVSAITGKIELLEDRDHQDLTAIGISLFGEGIKQLFSDIFPQLMNKKEKKAARARANDDMNINTLYAPIVDYFREGIRLEIDETMSDTDYQEALETVPTLKKIALKYGGDKEDLVFNMELLLDGLFNHSFINREIQDGSVTYLDVYSSMLKGFA